MPPVSGHAIAPTLPAQQPKRRAGAGHSPHQQTPGRPPHGAPPGARSAGHQHTNRESGTRVKLTCESCRTGARVRARTLPKKDQTGSRRPRHPAPDGDRPSARRCLRSAHLRPQRDLRFSGIAVGLGCAVRPKGRTHSEQPGAHTAGCGSPYAWSEQPEVPTIASTGREPGWRARSVASASSDFFRRLSAPLLNSASPTPRGADRPEIFLDVSRRDATRTEVCMPVLEFET